MKLPFWANLNTLAAAIILAMGVYIGLQKIELLTCRLHNKDYQHQLETLAKQSKQAQKQTERIVTRYVKVDGPRAEREAERVEKAPLPGQCATPKEVLQADL